MQWINDNTTGLRQTMVDIGVPDFNVGYSMNANLSGGGVSSTYQSPGGGEHLLSGVNDAREAYFYSRQNGNFKSYVEMTSSPNKGNGWYFGVSFDQNTGSILFENRTAAYDYMWEKSFSAGGKPIREVSGCT